MKCQTCGKILAENATVCDECATPVPAEQQKQRTLKNRAGFAVTSAIFGIIGIPAFGAVIFNLLAVLFGAISIRSTKSRFAKAGVILGIIGCVIAIISYSYLLSSTHLKEMTDYIYNNFI